MPWGFLPINNNEYSTIYGNQNMSTEPVFPQVTGTAPVQKTNPLAKFFRTPAIYIGLPSGGRYWPEGTLDMPENEELPVFPMTNRDEITLRTPDALINGQGVIDVIQSCIPNIKDGWKMPSLDVDACLMAIRIASYGHSMDFEQTCPACEHEDVYSMDLRHTMSTVKCPDYDHPGEFGPVRIKFKPQTYANVNKSNQVAFELQKMAQNAEDMSEEDQTVAAAVQLEKFSNLNIATMASVIEYIELVESGERIEDSEYIKEFFANIDNTLFMKIQEALVEITKDANVKPSKVACTNCGNEVELNIMFDYASFFARGS
jgi:transcription elongation factor Elf1